MKLHALLGHHASENFVVSNIEEQLCIVFMKRRGHIFF
jgi:hypothetical protein